MIFTWLVSRQDQTIMGFHSISLSAEVAARSRCTFFFIFCSQNSLFWTGSLPRGHECPCQKQPCTNTAVRYFGKTMSGEPGRSLRCSRKRKPSLCNRDLTMSSARVFLFRTRDIISRLFDSGNISVMAGSHFRYKHLVNSVGYSRGEDCRNRVAYLSGYFDLGP